MMYNYGYVYQYINPVHVFQGEKTSYIYLTKIVMMSFSIANKLQPFERDYSGVKNHYLLPSPWANFESEIN